MAKSNNKTHEKRMDKNCHIPDLVQAFSNVSYDEHKYMSTVFRVVFFFLISNFLLIRKLESLLYLSKTIV